MRREKGIGTQEVTVQILGDSFVNGAFSGTRCCRRIIFLV